MKRLLWIVCGVLALAGCSKTSGVTAPIGGTPPGTIADLVSWIRRSLPEDFVYPTNLDTTASLLVTSDVDGVGAAFGVFRSGFALVRAGTLTLNGAAVAQFAVPVNTVPQYFYSTYFTPPFDLPLTFDGQALHRFICQGYASIPAFQDTVRSVDLMELSAPVQNQRISKDEDFTLAWSDAGSDTTVYVAAAVYSLVDTTLHVALALGRDAPGTLVIPAARLQTAPIGGATLAIARFRLRYFTTGGVKIGMMSEATKTLTVAFY